MVKCISCDKRLPWQEAHAAHWISRGRASVRHDDTNVHSACAGCNVYHKERHMRGFTLAMLDLYGRDHLDWLEAESRRVVRHRVDDYLAIARHYEEAFELLES